MPETLSEKVVRLETEVLALKEALVEHTSGLRLQHVMWQRDVLARFARNCEDWGVLPCRCADRANDALREADMNTSE